mgnify:CR=1 FL=1
MSFIPPLRTIGRDTIRKAAIIGATAPLPRAARVAQRKARLGALELDIARRSALIIIAHPKSGNTWLKVMLTRLYSQRHGIPEADFARYPALADANPAIPRFAATNGWYSYERAVGDRLQPGAPDDALRHKPVILLARNPLDVAVSWYFQVTKRQSDHKHELINAGLSRPVDRRTIGLWEFVRHSEIGMPSLIAFLNYWDAALDHLDHTLLISYEQLRVDPGKVLARIIRLVGDSFTDDEIADAVAFASFENLRRMERAGFFRAGGLTLRDAKDPDSFKVRRAKVDGYRDYFDAAQAAELEALVARDLSPRLKALLGLGHRQDSAPVAPVKG